MRKKKLITHEFVLIIHNVRSALNVGALFRAADGAGVKKIFLTGYTSAPASERTLYLTTAQKTLRKTALGAEIFVPWEKASSVGTLLRALKRSGFEIVALEQSKGSIDYRKYVPKLKVALLVGNEVRGVDKKILAQCDKCIELPMRGRKNSLNVSVASGIALYHIASRMKV